MAATFEYYHNEEDSEWRFRLKASNGEIIAVGEGYESESNVKDGIERVQEQAPDASLEEVDE